MAIFKGLQIAIDLGYNVGFKKKLELRKKVIENEGIISFIVTKKCHFVVTSDAEKCQLSTKCRMATKYGLPVLKLDYIWDCLQEGRLLPKESYIVGGKSKYLDFKSGKISALNPPEKSKACALKATFNPKSVKNWSIGDETQPSFEEESYEVAKYSIFIGYNKLMKCQAAHILELHSSCTTSKTSGVKIEDENISNRCMFRITYQHGSIKDLEEGKACHTEYRYVSVAEHALACYAMLYEDLEKKTDLVKQVGPLRGIGSQKLQRLMAHSSNVNVGCSAEVKELIEHIWQEAMSEVTTLFGDLSTICLEQVEKAEAILLKIREAMKTSAADSQVQSLILEFYSILKHRNETSDVKEPERKKWCIQKQDMCQLLKDMISVSEMTNFQERSYTEAKYAALRCQITLLTDTKRQEIEEQVKASMKSSRNDLTVLNVFEVWRQVEDIDYRFDIEPKLLLFHSSRMENFVGILSRGLLLPKVIVDDMGGSRTDEGSLGCGIYFASDANTSVKYSAPSKTKGSRLLLMNEVTLGNIKDYNKHSTGLVAPPPGYNSTHGVSKQSDKSSMFQDDEYVVYNVNQQRVRYLVEFIVAGDKVKPLQEISDIDSNILCDSIENTTLNDVSGISDPMMKVVPGLVGNNNAQVELKGVHIRAKLIDLAAQVVVLQEYHNNSTEAVEAKYVFPLDDTAAVCGFEAFINGKHIVGVVKEKEVAHKEYKEAISQGHGAYLMDQDEETPDVFTVSVGNLPPAAHVLIKITYIAELQVEDELISFKLPATVAPWREDSALKYSIQEELTSHKMAAANTTVQVALEMPFEIRTLQCPTHKIKIKQTSTKAYVEMVRKQKFGSGFHLMVGLAEIHVPRMWVERLPDSQDQACMLTFFPEFEAPETTDGEIIVLLDNSNSMKGSTLNEAKKIALLILRSMQPNWHFNIMKFGSDYDELFSAPKLNTQDNIETANTFIQNCAANKGNTDVIHPLWSLFLLPNQKRQRNVFFISDGHINSHELVLQYSRKNSSHTRVFTFGVSDTCNSYALKALARVSGGAFEFFNIKAKSKWETKVNNQINKASQPGLTSVTVEWQQYDDNMPAPVQAPKQITSMFNGSRQVIYGFVPNCTMATLSANVGGQQASTVVSTSELSITEGHIVHRLTARAVIRDWEDGVLSSDRTDHEVAKMDQKNDIIRLSKEYSIVTQFTSFIAVEKREENEKENLPKGQSIKDLLNKENVDILPYMGWTKGLPGEDVPIELLLQQLGEEVKNGALSNKLVCSLDVIEEKLDLMKEQTGPCNKDIILNAKLLMQAYKLQSDNQKAADLAVDIFNGIVDNLNSVIGDADVYPKLVTYLHDLSNEASKIPGVQSRLNSIGLLPIHNEHYIDVKTLTGKTVRCPSSNTMTALDLKHIIMEKEGTPLEQQRICHQGKMLMDDDLLMDKDVNYGDCVHLVLRLRGGPVAEQEIETHSICDNSSESPIETYDKKYRVESRCISYQRIYNWEESVDERSKGTDSELKSHPLLLDADYLMLDSGTIDSVRVEGLFSKEPLAKKKPPAALPQEQEKDKRARSKRSYRPKKDKLFSLCERESDKSYEDTPPVYSEDLGSSFSSIQSESADQLLCSTHSRRAQVRKTQSVFSAHKVGTARSLEYGHKARSAKLKGLDSSAPPTGVEDTELSHSMRLSLVNTATPKPIISRKQSSLATHSPPPSLDVLSEKSVDDLEFSASAPFQSSAALPPPPPLLRQSGSFGSSAGESDYRAMLLQSSAALPSRKSGRFGSSAGDSDYRAKSSITLGESSGDSEYKIKSIHNAAQQSLKSHLREFGGFGVSSEQDQPSQPSQGFGSVTQVSADATLSNYSSIKYRNERGPPLPPLPPRAPLPLVTGANFGSKAGAPQAKGAIFGSSEEAPPPLAKKKIFGCSPGAPPPQAAVFGGSPGAPPPPPQAAVFGGLPGAPPPPPQAAVFGGSPGAPPPQAAVFGCLPGASPATGGILDYSVRGSEYRSATKTSNASSIIVGFSDSKSSSTGSYSFGSLLTKFRSPKDYACFNSYVERSRTEEEENVYNSSDYIPVSDSKGSSKVPETLTADEDMYGNLQDIYEYDGEEIEEMDTLNNQAEDGLRMVHSSEELQIIDESQFTEKQALSSFGIGTNVSRIRCAFKRMNRDTLMKLLDCQKTDGSWKFGTELDELIAIDSEKCLQILYQSGLKSLGKTVKHNIKRFLATALVLYTILEVVEEKIDLEFLLSLLELDINSYIKANERALVNLGLEYNMSTVIKALRKALGLCDSISKMYPMVPSSLELGHSWCHVLHNLMNGQFNSCE